MRKKRVKKVPGAGGRETAYQNAPATRSKAKKKRIRLSLQERFQLTVRELQDRYMIPNDAGKEVLFYGKAKEDFIQTFEHYSFALLAWSSSRA